MNKWVTARLGDVCQMIKRGVAPKYIEESGICVINQKCVRDHSISYILSRRHDLELKKINDERYIKIGDVLVNSTGTGTLGRVAQIREEPPEPTTVDTHVTIVRPKVGMFFNDFFGYMLIKIEEEITSSGEGASGQTELARTALENNFYVSFPESIKEQKRIVAILDLAFADIEKSRANAEQNLKNARELFESYLQQVFSQNGKDWVLTDIESLVKEEILGKPLDGNHGDIHPKRSDYVEDGTPFIMASDINSGLVDTQSCKFISKELAASLRKGFAKDGDVLLSHKATIGRSAILQTTLDYVMLTPQVTYYRVLNNKKLTNTYVYWYFNSPDFLKEMNEYARVGSTRAYIGITKQLKLKFSYPSFDKQKKIVLKLKSLSVEIVRLEKIYNQKIETLDELKKSILQKAFTGELTKKEVV